METRKIREGEVRGLSTADGKICFAIVRRPDGLHTYYVDELLYDEEDDVSYWSRHSNTFGVFETVDDVERYLTSLSGWGQTDFKWSQVVTDRPRL